MAPKDRPSSHQEKKHSTDQMSSSQEVLRGEISICNLAPYEGSNNAAQPEGGKEPADHRVAESE